MKIKYHFFIAHSSADNLIAKKIYSLFHPHFNVFLDIESLKAGDVWDEKIAEAQFDSLITIMLISSNTDKSFYQKEEILNAIELYRENPKCHRIIPIYIDDNLTNLNIPYGLRRIQGISIKTKSLNEIANEIYRTLFSMDYEEIGEFEYLKSMNSAEEKRIDILKKSKKDYTGFKKDIQNIIKRHYSLKSPTYIIYMDIDNFNAINRVHGNIIGNKILEVINTIIKEKANNFYWKNINSDEFVICPRLLDKFKTIDLIEEIRLSLINFDWTFLNNALYVSASFGYAKLEMDSDKTLNTLMNEWIVRAIHGCFKAKKKGGNSHAEGPWVLSKTVVKEFERYGS